MFVLLQFSKILAIIFIIDSCISGMLKTTMGSMDLEKKHSTVIVILEMVEVLTTTTNNS